MSEICREKESNVHIPLVMRILRSLSAAWLRKVLASSLLILLLLLVLSIHSQSRGNSEYEWRSKNDLWRRRTLRKGDGPVTHFIYYVPQKTSSTQTRGRMHKFCEKHDLLCLEDQYKNCSRIRFQSCMRSKIAKHVKMDISDRIHKGVVTVEKLKLCCKESAWNRTFDGAFYHYWYADPESRKYLRDHTYSDAFEFTILRDPVDHFISWYNYIITNKASIKLNSQVMALLKKKTTPDIEEIVDLLYPDGKSNFINTTYPFEKYGRRPRNAETQNWQMHEFLSNVQSKMLGWDGKPENWGVALNKLESLDFVGITEELCCTWKLLRAKLNWEKEDLSCNKKMTIHRYKIKDSTLRKIRAMQWADLALYERAQTIFRRYGAMCQGSIPQSVRYLGVTEPPTSTNEDIDLDDLDDENDTLEDTTTEEDGALDNDGGLDDDAALDDAAALNDDETSTTDDDGDRGKFLDEKQLLEFADAKAS